MAQVHPVSYSTREEWLEAAAGQLLALLPEGTSLPPIKLSVGWPKGGSRSHRGQCWGEAHSTDGVTRHVFLSPTLVDPSSVLVVLLHEIIHAVVGAEEGHRGAFMRTARSVGMLPPWTSAIPSAGLVERVQEVAALLGSYPHVEMLPLERKRQSTRMRLWVCPCGTKLRHSGRGLRVQCLKCQAIFREG